MGSENPEFLRELHSDLSRKYKAHSQAIERIWRSLDGPQRAKCLKAGAADGVVLRHSADVSLGNVYKIVPEVNLRDVAEPESDYLLHHLKHRATVPLSRQYCDGVDGELGDHGFICKMMARTGLRAANEYKNCYTLFYDDEKYGDSIRIAPQHSREVLSQLAPAIRRQLIVPRAVGELILTRQTTILQVLNILIQDILEAGSDDKRQKRAPRKTAKPAPQALPQLTSAHGQPKLTMSDIIANAQEQQFSLEDDVELVLTEPVVLAHAVNLRFFTQPELVADEKGRRAPAYTDKYISPVFCETIQDAIKGASIWSYINHLLQHLQGPALDRAYRIIMQQELVNAYHIEYTRAQRNFKRFVQVHSGAKWFKRIVNAQEPDGTARVLLKGNDIQNLFGTDTQLYYVLRLCQPETNPSKAKEWMGKLSDLHRNHPAEKERLHETEVDGLADLAVIIAFIQDITSAMSLPPVSRKQGQTLTRKLQELDMGLAQVKTGVDVRDFAAPIDHLLEDGMAAGALKSLDEYCCNALGATMSAAYQKLISECVTEVGQRYQQVKTQTEQSNIKSCPPFSQTEESTGFSIQPRPGKRKGKEKRKNKEKEKEHGAEAAVFGEAKDASPTGASTATATSTSTPTPVHDEPPPKASTLQVKAATAQLFRSIFQKSQARGAVSWDAFESAMANVGFSVVPKFGSVITFLPPSAMQVKKPMTIHRPHTAQIEGYRLLLIAKRLGRIYGWKEETFQEA
ncbi:hypothetical protein E4U43_007554 [Claviceps pusilla]|uniref:Ipa protein n=1 Tax=Claviceps pusilla TaxID=123648 RepID=A0A9P7NEJ8_9HYPO|nr:hypothetical protein E4U43_007554 [Claviceps pusilla]